jgi:hypothetical protein
MEMVLTAVISAFEQRGFSYDADFRTGGLKVARDGRHYQVDVFANCIEVGEFTKGGRYLKHRGCHQPVEGCSNPSESAVQSFVARVGSKPGN